MTPERWQLVKRILEAALERDPAGRARLLDEACRNDEPLRQEVESLIASYQQAGSLLDSPALEDPTKILSDTAAQSSGSRRIGPYKVIREIGHGGMGTVFLASRADDQYRRAVAIKLIRRGMDTDSILSRFRHERQILASLDHPNIARLLEGGTTDDGLPYFVMEYIEGQTIDQYCDTRKLTTADRLKLFRTVCSAVQYAHQNLIVHRDIKPSNILVTSEGVPKLLDFGIAKLLKPEMYAQTIAPTETFVRPMTPDYASPEQVRGQPITTASDLYSLGVLLYELLTGHRPYRISGYTPQAIEQAICEQEPERPSTAINRIETVSSSGGAVETTLTPELVSKTREGQPDKLRRKLAGDLDNIVLKAMRKEAQRRYASVEQFSEDIRRHLEGRPVIARKDTFGYSAGKFIQRHKLGVAGVTAFVILTIVAVIAIVIQSARATRERDKAQQVSGFLVDIFKVSDPSESRGNSVTAREILDKGAERVERELNAQPEVQATLLDTIGNVYHSLGLYDKAIPLLEKSLQIRRETLGTENLDTAQTLYDLGSTLKDKQKTAEAEPPLRESLAIRRKLLGNENAAVANCLDLIAETLWLKGDLATAEPLYREGLALRRKIFGNVHHDVAQSLSKLASLLWTKGEYDAAEPLNQEAIAIDRKLTGGDDTDLALHLSNYAVLKDNKGDSAAAESLQREALAIRRKLLGNEHPDVAVSLNNLAGTLRKRGNYAEAEPLYREALRIGRNQYGEENQNVAMFEQNLARALYDQEDFARAEPLFREALAKQQRILGENHPRTCQARSLLATLLYDKGEVKIAEEMFRQLLEPQRKAYPNGHQEIAETEVGLGRLLSEHEHAREAEPLLREAVAMMQKIFPDNNFKLADARGALGECLTQLKNFDEAEALLIKSYSTLKAQRSENDLYRRRATARLLDLYKAWGKPDKLAQYRAMAAS
jgi:eukaryotic-like serine/threonine-protein kinase